MAAADERSTTVDTAVDAMLDEYTKEFTDKSTVGTSVGASAAAIIGGKQPGAAKDELPVLKKDDGK